MKNGDLSEDAKEEKSGGTKRLNVGRERISSRTEEEGEDKSKDEKKGNEDRIDNQKQIRNYSS